MSNPACESAQLQSISEFSEVEPRVSAGHIAVELEIFFCMLFGMGVRLPDWQVRDSTVLFHRRRQRWI